MNTERRRARGTGRIFLRGRTYWIAYCVDGRERRESARTDDHAKAERLLNRRIVEAEDRRLPAPSRERKKSVNDLLDALLKDMAARQCDSAHNMISALKPIREALGERRASSITRDDLTQYIINRREEGYAEASIAKQLDSLRRAYKLQKAILVPDFPSNPKGRIRDWLVAPTDQRRLLAALDYDECYRDMAEFYFATGWRGKEIRTLQWKFVRQDSGLIRLAAEYSKTDEGRDFPLTGRVADIIERWRAKRLPICPFVFHRRGCPVCYRSWLTAFEQAACKIGLGSHDRNRPKYQRYVGPKPHDSRRSFITESVDAGNDPQTVMMLSGHRSPRIFNNYRRVKLDILARAVARREEYAAECASDAKVVVLADRRHGQNSDNSGSELRKANGEKGSD